MYVVGLIIGNHPVRITIPAAERRGHGCLCCVLYSEDKRHNQDTKLHVKYKVKKKKSVVGVDVFFECCVLSGRGLCAGPIPRPGESYRLWCVIVCDLGTSAVRRPWSESGCCAKGEGGRFRTPS